MCVSVCAHMPCEHVSARVSVLCVCACVRMCESVYVCVHVSVDMHECMHVCLHVSVCAYECTRVHVCLVHVCECAWVCTCM